MSMFTGFASRGNLARIAGTSVLSAAALAAFSIAEPAKSADLDYRYGERYDYQAPAEPRPRYGEYYEYRTPAAPEHYGETREYRVVVQPVKRHKHYGYSPAYPPPAYGEHYYEEEYEYQPAEIAPRRAPRVVYNETVVEEQYPDVPYEPYGRAVEVEPLLPPAPIGPTSRW